jgi:hypothetical protein
VVAIELVINNSDELPRNLVHLPCWMERMDSDRPEGEVSFVTFGSCFARGNEDCQSGKEMRTSRVRTRIFPRVERDAQQRPLYRHNMLLLLSKQKPGSRYDEYYEASISCDRNRWPFIDRLQPLKVATTL